MTKWPVAPLIRITKGTADGYKLNNVVAIKGNAANAYRGYGLHLVEGWDGDEIEEWEEVEAVPTAALKRLRDVFLGVELPFAQFAAIQQVTSYLPPNEPSALDQAVAKVKVLGDLPSNLDHPRQEERLALLLRSLATLQGVKHKAQTLATIVCVCTTWANALSVAGGSLDEVRWRVESDPDRGGFAVMANIAGDVARDIDDGLTKSRKQNLLTIAQYALEWLAELIEKEEA